MKPVQYTSANQALVDAFENLDPQNKDPGYWGDDAVAAVRKQAKDHYIAEQHQRCCYCNLKYPTGNNAVWDGEHIIARSKDPKFLFEPRNLAAACKDCNISKGEDEVRVNPRRVSFPDKSQHYLIVHPHFDNYDDHIRWYGDVVRPLTSKGVKLIEMCNLWRFGLVKVGEKILPLNSQVDGLVGKFMDPHASKLDLEMSLAAFAAYVKGVPQP